MKLNGMYDGLKASPRARLLCSKVSGTVGMEVRMTGEYRAKTDALSLYLDLHPAGPAPYPPEACGKVAVVLRPLKKVDWAGLADPSKSPLADFVAPESLPFVATTIERNFGLRRIAELEDIKRIRAKARRETRKLDRMFQKEEAR